MTAPWWSGLARVELPIGCGDHEHRLRWADGVFSAADHPDAERERMLAALGADPYACLELVDLWDAHADDLEVLVRASRGPADPLGGDDDDDRPVRKHGVMYHGSRPAHGLPSQLRPGTMFGWYGQPVRGDGSSHDGLTRLLTLAGGLPDRLVATVISTWIERNETGDPRAVPAVPALKAALYGRFVAVVHSWLGLPARIELIVVESGRRPSLTRRDGGLRAEVPLTWLSDVWCRDLATMAGRLTLAAAKVGDTTWELTTIGPDFGPPRTMTLSL